MNFSPPIPINQGMSALSGKRILVVDDDEPMLLAVSKVLTRGGARVEAASTTVDAMALMSDKEIWFDAVLTDLRMPVTSGKFILSVIKTMHPDMPVLIMSAFWTPEMKTECLQLGVAQCLDKPLDASHLLGAIARTLEGPRH